jgi:hypothetical protein
VIRWRARRRWIWPKLGIIVVMFLTAFLLQRFVTTYFTRLPPDSLLQPLFQFLVRWITLT